MPATWSPDPPTEPGRYWKVERHSCGKCWGEPAPAEILGTPGNLMEVGQFSLDLCAREDTRWGSKIESPPLPGEE